MAATPANVSDELFAELQKHFTDAQLVELVTDIAMGNMRSRFNRAFLCRPAGFSEGAFCPLPEKLYLPSGEPGAAGQKHGG